MSRFAHTFIALLLFSVLAAGAPFRVPANSLPFHSPETESWVAASVAGSQDPLVYVSVISSLTSGATQIYDVANGSATYVGQLNRGGGATAVDSQQNVYVIEADYDQNFFQQRSHVYVYARGSSRPSRDFVAQGLGAQAMTVGADGTVYMAGQLYPNIYSFGVMKFPAGSSTGQWLPTDANQPIFPKGIAVDSAGNLFVGWESGFKNLPREDPSSPCYFGCIESIAPDRQSPDGGHTPAPWATRVPELEADGMEAGPFLKADGSLIFWTSKVGRYSYIETVSAKSQHPSQVAQLSPTLFLSDPWVAALNGDGTEIWGAAIGFLGGPGSTVYRIDYPSGSVSASFQLAEPKPFYFAVSLAVSPTHYPPQ